MADIELLKNKIESSGMTMSSVAKKSGIVRETLYNRLNGIGEFTASEIVGLSKTLRLSVEERDQIFLNDALFKELVDSPQKRTEKTEEVSMIFL